MATRSAWADRTPSRSLLISIAELLLVMDMLPWAAESAIISQCCSSAYITDDDNGAVIARQTETLYMGRVMSLTLMAFAGFSLTALPLGIAADYLGERMVLFGMGASLLVLAIVMSLVVARDTHRADHVSRL